MNHEEKVRMTTLAHLVLGVCRTRKRGTLYDAIPAGRVAELEEIAERTVDWLEGAEAEGEPELLPETEPPELLAPGEPLGPEFPPRPAGYVGDWPPTPKP